jgi:hypothetical protein
MLAALNFDPPAMPNHNLFTHPETEPGSSLALRSIEWFKQMFEHLFWYPGAIVSNRQMNG